MGGRRRRVLGQRVSDLRRRQGPKGSGHRLRGLLVAALGVVVFLLPAGASGRASPTSGTVAPVTYGTQGANGWYITNVTVNWVIQPLGYLSTEGCDARTIATDTVNTDLTCTATWSDGNASSTVHIHRDATPPTVTVTPDRAPDANGWYNKPVGFTYSGADPTSGVASCSRVAYAGPDNTNATVTGTCSDNAGNVASVTKTLKYDATPPKIKKFDLKARKGGAQLLWRGSADVKSVELLRAPGLKGAAQSAVFTGTGLSTGFTDRGLRPGREYRYQLTVSDDAANKTTQTMNFVARGALLAPAPGERVTKAPLLVWTPVRGASYYNVVLVRGRRVFSAWPTRTRLKLPRAWTYHGRRYTLRSGSYRWIVWPGFGSLSAGRYGKMLGGSTFTFGGPG